MPNLTQSGCSRNSRPSWMPEEVADHRHAAAPKKDPELDMGEQRAVDLALGLLGQEVVGGAEEAEQQPDDQRVGVDHPHDVERQRLGEQIRRDVDRAGEQPNSTWASEQGHGHEEIGKAIFWV